MYVSHSSFHFPFLLSKLNCRVKLLVGRSAWRVTHGKPVATMDILRSPGTGLKSQLQASGTRKRRYLVLRRWIQVTTVPGWGKRSTRFVTNSRLSRRFVASHHQIHVWLSDRLDISLATTPQITGQCWMSLGGVIALRQVIHSTLGSVMFGKSFVGYWSIIDVNLTLYIKMPCTHH